MSPSDNTHQNADEDARPQRSCIGLVGPCLLVGQHARQDLGARIALLRGIAQVGEPRYREQHARFGIGACRNAVDFVDYRALVVKMHAAIKRPMAPRVRVLGRRHGLASRDGQGHRQVDVLRIHRPAVGDVLPIELAHVIVCSNGIHHGVVDARDHAFVGGFEEHVQGIAGFIPRPRFASGAARAAPGGLNGPRRWRAIAHRHASLNRPAAMTRRSPGYAHPMAGCRNPTTRR